MRNVTKMLDWKGNIYLFYEPLARKIYWWFWTCNHGIIHSSYSSWSQTSDDLIMHQRPVGHSPGTNGSLTLDQLVIAQGPDWLWSCEQFALDQEKDGHEPRQICKKKLRLVGGRFWTSRPWTSWFWNWDQLLLDLRVQ